MPLSDVSSNLMERYEAYLQQRQVCPNTTSFYMRRLRATYNLAVADRLVTNNSPFRSVYTGIAKTNKRAITISDMSHIRQLKLTDHSLELARNPEPLGFAASRVEELFVAQELIKIFKLKCCGI